MIDLTNVYVDEYDGFNCSTSVPALIVTSL